MTELLSVALFVALDLETLAALATCSQRLTFRSGEQICRLGERSDAMYVLVRGETEAWIEGAEGRRLALGHARPGAVFGELGVITGRPRSASIEVSSQSATVIAIPRDAVEGVLARDLQAALGVLKVVSGYLLDTLAATGAQAPHRQRETSAVAQ